MLKIACCVGNEGPLDRLIRVFVGEVLLFSGYLFLDGVLQIVAFVFAAAMFFTALIGYCTPYALLKVSTLKWGSPLKPITAVLFGFLYIATAILFFFLNK